MIIAVDGPAAAGKGTLTRRLAGHYGLRCLDTGSLYRSVAATLIAAGSDPQDTAAAVAAAETVDPRRFAASELRAPGTGHAASIIAAEPDVRAALLIFQRAFAARPPGAVLDGRDIGTVVCPDADVKLFVTASVGARAERRWLELREADPGAQLEDVRADLERRDARDASRDTAPMRAAADAHLLDTTEMDIDTAFREAVAIIDAARG